MPREVVGRRALECQRAHCLAELRHEIPAGFLRDTLARREKRVVDRIAQRRHDDTHAVQPHHVIAVGMVGRIGRRPFHIQWLIGLLEARQVGLDAGLGAPIRLAVQQCVGRDAQRRPAGLHALQHLSFLRLRHKDQAGAVRHPGRPLMVFQRRDPHEIQRARGIGLVDFARAVLLGDERDVRAIGRPGRLVGLSHARRRQTPDVRAVGIHHEDRPWCPRAARCTRAACRPETRQGRSRVRESRARGW